ncbi:MAG: hypothetical protein ACM33C_02565, partial [Syntrophaceae bacterium]
MTRMGERRLRWITICLMAIGALICLHPAESAPEKQTVPAATSQDRKSFVIASQRNAPPFSFAGRE